MNNLVTYHLFNGTLPPITAKIYEYLLAGNGIFLRAKRKGLTVVAPLQNLKINGLPELKPYIQLHYPKVPNYLVSKILQLSQEVAPLEIMFQLYWQDEDGWQLILPEQTATSYHLEWKSHYPQAPLVEIHSHHSGEAYFSATDNADENGFAIYGVLGKIFSKPQLKLRIGIYHQLFWEIDPNLILELTTSK